MSIRNEQFLLAKKNLTRLFVRFFCMITVLYVCVRYVL